MASFLGGLGLFKRKAAAATTSRLRHATAARSTLSGYCAATLGAGDLEGSLQCPEGYSVDDHLATFVVDAYNEVSLLWGALSDACSCSTMSAGPRFQFLLEGTPPRACSAVDYVEAVFAATEAQLADPALFPTDTAVSCRGAQVLLPSLTMTSSHTPTYLPHPPLPSALSRLTSRHAWGSCANASCALTCTSTARTRPRWRRMV